MDETLAAARDAWPELDIEPERFRAYLVERAGELSAASLEGRRLDDLYLACACALGLEGAAATFRRAFHGAIVAAVARTAPERMRDEICQIVLTKLLVRTGERPPAIASYQGVGKLATWVQVVAAREARSKLRSENRHGGGVQRDGVDELADRASSEDALLDALKQKYRAEFKQAFRTALGRLSARERNLIRYECFDHLTREDIARIYGVSLATVARWRAHCRDRLREESLRAFGEGLELDASELHGVMDMIKSQLEVSLARLLESRSE